MKAAVLLAAASVLVAQQSPGVGAPPPGGTSGVTRVDTLDALPLLLGETTGKAILAHRATFRENQAKMRVPAALKLRWKAVRTPLTLVSVFGSWCSDSQFHLPNLLTLASKPNPFIEVHFLGVDRDKLVEEKDWPVGCPPQKVLRVPTFFLFATGPGGGQRLVGTLVEGPPRAGMTMAQALVELVEAAEKNPPS